MQQWPGNFFKDRAIDLRLFTLQQKLELFLLRLLRGSGGKGLAGMKWRSSSPANPIIQLVRPLLDLPKAALREYSRTRPVRFREDASNACLDFHRNRIRHELIPLLKQKYQPALDKVIPRVMDIIGAVAIALLLWVGREQVKNGYMSTGQFIAFPPSGKHAQWRSVGFFRVEDGLIAEHWETVDWVRVYQSFGLLSDDVKDS